MAQQIIDNNGIGCFVDNNGVTCWVDDQGNTLCCGFQDPPPKKHPTKQHVYSNLNWQQAR